MTFLANRASRAALFGGFAVLLVLAAAAPAADYPSRPVTLVVAFPPGGPSDVLARIVGKKIEELLGQPFVIENKPGRRWKHRRRFCRARDGRRLHAADGQQ
jgi:tripartite-type tricarboxylate transporter receptor subunit TctC